MYSEFLKKYRDKSFFILPILVFIFWYSIYPYHLLYQEKITLFLYRSDFFTSKLLYPGGLSEYIGLYITHFFTSPWICSLLLTILFTVIFLLVTGILRKTEVIKSGYAFCWLPSLALLGLQMHYDFFLSESLKVLFFYSIIYLYIYISSFPIKNIMAIVLAPLFFTLIGGGFYSILYLTFILFELIKGKNDWKFISGYLIIGIILPLIWKQFVFISNKELYGFFHLESINNWSVLTYVTAYFLPIIFLLKGIKLTPLFYSKGVLRKIGLIFNYVIIFYFIFQLNHYCYHPQVEKIFRMEYALTEENWDEILATSKKYNGQNVSVTVLTNLALAKKGLLNEELFQYPQMGVWGLVHPPENTYFFNIHNHEVFSHLDNLNESFHWLFEAFVSEQQGSYTLKKMASHLIEFGKFQAARSFLLELLYTPQFEEWAKEQLKNLPSKDIPIKISGREQDFIMNIMGPFNDLINMAQNNPQNNKIRDYLLVSLLLEKQLEDYYSFFKFYYQSSYRKEKKLPKVYEEALFLIYQELDEEVFKKFPLSSETTQLFQAYIEDINRKEIPTMKQTDKIKDKYGNTLWYYYHFSN